MAGGGEIEMTRGFVVGSLLEVVATAVFDGGERNRLWRHLVHPRQSRSHTVGFPGRSHR